jgi:hypothetical protein
MNTSETSNTTQLSSVSEIPESDPGSPCQSPLGVDTEAWPVWDDDEVSTNSIICINVI